MLGTRRVWVVVKSVVSRRDRVPCQPPRPSPADSVPVPVPEDHS